MGFRVESYSLNELHRISVPGAVAPTLFWALPIGNWQQGELDEVWRWFTVRSSKCNDFGLLLVKGMGRREGGVANVNLASVGAKLSDLMPAGAERFDPGLAFRDESPRMLVLSGGYPQPGWGVLVEWQQLNTYLFEDLIQKTILQMRGEDSREKLNVFREAARTFHDLRKLSVAPAKPNVSAIDGEILTAQRVADLLHEAQVALQTGEYLLVRERLIAAIQGTEQAAWLKISAASLQPLREAQKTLRIATSLLAVPNEVLAEEIEPKLPTLIADHSKREDDFRNLSSESLTNALKACLFLRDKGIVEEAGSFQAWATQTLAELPTTLEANMAELSKDIEAKLVTHLGSMAHLEHRHQRTMNEWRQKLVEARESFHVAAGKAMELQWELGPQFLVAFERICRQVGLWVRSIPWDPARMVGWKIMASQVILNVFNLQSHAEELAPGAMGAYPIIDNRNAVMDGSYFTDYVHYIAISKPEFSPRTITRDLVARLLQPTQIRDLILDHGGQAPIMLREPPHLAEKLLHVFGWRQSDEWREKPLAGCIKTGGDNTPALAENLSGNDLRIVLESFCKDIVDVVVATLGYDHTSIWRVIEERIPAYQPTSWAMDWEEEVRRMTVGAAVMILPALGRLAFPARATEVNEFVTSLGELARLLNRAAHHQEGEPETLGELGEAPALIRQLLGKAEAFLGELPWHLDASFVYGKQPKVLSGEAWSHGSPTPRLLRVIVWTGASPGTHVTFWNRERRNPVVPDPVFIVRPRRGQ